MSPQWLEYWGFASLDPGDPDALKARVTQSFSISLLSALLFSCFGLHRMLPFSPDLPDCGCDGNTEQVPEENATQGGANIGGKIGPEKWGDGKS